jgi:predicted phage terminase large subunit-like protein
VPKAKDKAKSQALTPAEAVQKARENPVAFIALSIGKPVSALQRELLSHALGHHSWYAELPRGHAKTSTLTYLCAWWLGKRPSTRFKLIGSNDDAAAATSRFLREVIRSPLYQTVFPHVKLKPGEDTVMAWSVTAPGLPARRDPSVQASGIFGRTGGRADVLWPDDICDLRNAVLQPALREQVKEALANIWLPMLDPSAAHPGRIWRTATPFHTDDVTADWRKECQSAGTLLRRPCTGTESPWPEVFTPDLLERNRRAMGPMAYARAYELVPLSSDLLVFRPEWMRYHAIGEIPSGARTVAAIDWGYGRKRQERDDPDYSVCIVGEVDANRTLYLTDILRVREAFPDFARMARELVERRGCAMVLAEANGPQKGVFDQFRSSTRCPVVPVERGADKHLRAAGAQPFIEQGKLSFPQTQDGQVSNAFRPVVDELLSFPAGAHDDTVDVVVDLCNAAASGTLVSAGGVLTVTTTPTRLFDSRPMKGRFFG